MAFYLLRFFQDHVRHKLFIKAIHSNDAKQTDILAIYSLFINGKVLKLCTLFREQMADRAEKFSNGTANALLGVHEHHYHNRKRSTAVYRRPLKFTKQTDPATPVSMGFPRLLRDRRSIFLDANTASTSPWMPLKKFSTTRWTACLLKDADSQKATFNQ